MARAGLDIVRLRAGLERLTLYAMGQPTITADDVRQAVPAGPEAQADFGIANAIQRNDVREALREAGALARCGHVPFIHPGPVAGSPRRGCRGRGCGRRSTRCFRTDIALKSSGGDPRILLERLVVELCESRRA